MSLLVTLAELKTQLRLEVDDTVEDDYLLLLVGAAQRSCEKKIDRSVDDLDPADLIVVAQAILLICSHWYRNREAVALDVRTAPVELPIAVTWLLEPLRRIPLA